MINPHTKFKVEDMKGNAKYRRNWDGSGWASSNVTGNVTIRYIAYDFLFDNQKLLAYLVQFSSYSELFVKAANFNLPHLHLEPPLG